MRPLVCQNSVSAAEDGFRTIRSEFSTMGPVAIRGTAGTNVVALGGGFPTKTSEEKASELPVTR